MLTLVADESHRNQGPPTVGLPHDLRRHFADDRANAGRAHPSPRPCARRALREARGREPRRLGEGSPRARHHRGRRASGRAEVRADGRGGDVGQHRHRARARLRGARLSVRGDHAGVVLGRAAPDHARLRREGRPHPGRREGVGRSAPRGEARGGARVVPRAAVRQRSESRLPPPDDRRRDPLRFREQAARLLGHRLGDGRNAHRRGAGDQVRAPGDEDHRVRAGGRVAPRGQGVEAAQDPGVDARLRALGARSRRLRRRDPGRGRQGDRLRARSREARGHLLRDLGRRHVRRGARGRGQGGEGQRHPRDAPRHRRALPVDGALRGRGNGVGRDLRRIFHGRNHAPSHVRGSACPSGRCQ